MVAWAAPQSKKIRENTKFSLRGDNMHKVLTVKEVSEILRLGKNQTYTLMNNKTFPSYRIGNKLFVTEEALNNWLSNISGRHILL